jgi:hypothetical protein
MSIKRFLFVFLFLLPIALVGFVAYVLISRSVNNRNISVPDGQIPYVSVGNDADDKFIVENLV